MWPFKKKFEIREGRRYCPDCGKKIDMMDHALSTDERVFCKRCKRFVWIGKDWSEKTIRGPMTEERMASLEQLKGYEQQERSEVRSTPKTVPIIAKFCTYCQAQIESSFYKYKDRPESLLQCPNCGDVRFYEDVRPLPEEAK